MPVDAELRPHRPPGPSGIALSAAYLAAVLVPAAAAAMAVPGDVYARLATSTGVAAIAVLLAQFLTSGRFESVSGRIGLDATMSFHRLAGAAAVLLVVVHVVAVGLRFGWPGLDRFAARLGHSLVAPGNASGVAALALLAPLVAWAKWGRGRVLRYEAWRMAHGAGAVLVVLLAADHLWRRSDGVATPLAAIVLAALLVAALGSLAVVWALRPRKAYGLKFRVRAVRRIAPSLVEIEAVTDAPGRFSFRAGQFAWICFGGRHTVSDHPFSIASPPEDLPAIRFLVREAGDGTRSMIRLAPGATMAVDGPHGSFVDPGGTGDVAMVAGGIGIAPLLAILRSAAARGDRRRFRLLLAVRTAADLAAAADLDALAGRLDLRADVLVEEGDPTAGARSGRIDGSALRAALSGLADPVAFVCGPPAMMDRAIGLLLEAGVRRDRIVMERFDYDAAHDALSRARWRAFLAVFAAIGAGLVLASLA